MRFDRLPRYQRALIVAVCFVGLTGLIELLAFATLYVGYVFSARHFPAYYLRAKATPRLEWRVRDQRWVYDPYLLFRNAPNATIWEGVVTDSYGFIPNDAGKSFNPVKPPGTFRIFFLGGSSAASYHAGSNALTIPALLEGFLNRDDRLKRKYHADRFEVVNAGVSGYFSTQEFLFASLVLVNYEPDMFIVYNGYNEWAWSTLRGWKPHAHAYAQDLERGVNRLYTVSGSFLQMIQTGARKLVDRLSGVYKYSSALLDYVVDKMRYVLGYPGRGILLRYENDRRTIRGPVNRRSIEVYRENIVNMISLCETRGIALYYLLQPSLTRLEGPSAVVEPMRPVVALKNAYFEELRSMFRTFERRDGAKCEVADLTDVFAGTPQSPFLDAPFDLVHLNRFGNEMITKRIAELLR